MVARIASTTSTVWLRTTSSKLNLALISSNKLLLLTTTKRLRILQSPSSTRTTGLRSFSLWPTAAPSPTLSSPSVPVEAPPEPDTMQQSVASQITTIEPTFFEPFSQAFLSLPPALGISYALLIPFATIIVRTTTTLPISLWQRARTRYFANTVMPLVRNAQTVARYQVRDECRRANKSYEEYEKAFKAKATELARAIIKQHKANPRVTLLVPPLLHIPLFIFNTLLIRDAAERSLNSITLFPSSEAHHYSTQALSHLHDFATTPFLWCNSLVMPDPIMGLPLMIGIVALANIEVTAQSRKITTEHTLAQADARAKDWEQEMKQGINASLSARDKGRRAVLAARASSSAVSSPIPARDQKRHYAISALAKHNRRLEQQKRPSETATSVEENTVEEKKAESRRTRIWTNAMRCAAICFVPVAAVAPAAVCVYWLTSNTFTLIQSILFAIADRKRESELPRGSAAGQ
ncbi:hypothetical protein T439DRAFT_378147 [Meredithblackwellia eburnea MCA 4105]